MTASWDGFSLRWVVGPETELTLRESGSDPERPPILVLSGEPCVVTLSPPDDVTAWLGCAEMLRQLRDNAEDMAKLLEARATELRTRDDHEN
ncbi:hypothetical protein [Amycolatopsis sp. NPDC001319]|uniref:hypothetical protein n=1 Tax=unclassified Amycolatopsis TaxID=2618356 RepID=UPI0036D18110